MIYRFENCELDTVRFELRCSGSPVKVEPQVFALLELLVANHDRLVTKDEINEKVWGGRVVSEAVVNSRIKAARKVVNDDGKTQRLIKTVHRRGFRFDADVQVSSTPPYALQISMPNTPDSSTSSALLPGDQPSVAVMPLKVLSDNARYGNLGDAISHEIIVELSRLHWLFVIARGSSFRLRDPGPDLAGVGYILGARYILNGSIAFYDRTSAVTVELVEAATGRVVWADRYESPVDDLLQLRLSISAQVVSALETRIQIAEAHRTSREPTESLDAWSAYHRALSHMYRFNKHDNQVAANLFERAISADPNFARAYAGLSFTHFQNILVGYSSDLAGERDLVRKFADRSMEIDPLDPFVNLTMGRTEWADGNLTQAMPWFDRSIELNPNYALALYNKGLLDALLGAGQASQSNVTRAIALSPIDPLGYAMLATRALSHIVREQYATAAEWADRAVGSPNAHVHIYAICALAHELAGNRTRAMAQAAHIKTQPIRFDKNSFLNMFSFRDRGTFDTVNGALERLNL